MDIQVVENVTKLNDDIAALNRADLQRAGVFCIDLMGAPGCGKTALIEATVPRLDGVRTGIIVGDLATRRDAERIARVSQHVVQINTGKTCHLEANHVRQALGRIDLSQIDLLFIENVGNLICPVGFDLGQDTKIGLFAVSDGDDKAAKHPYIVTESSLLILGKTDLLPYIPFDLPLFREDVKRLNPAAELLELSTRTGDGMDRWTSWIARQIEQARAAAGHSHPAV